MLAGYRREVLANGLRVVGVRNPALHSFVCSVGVRVGPRFEGPEQVGLSHFLEHMLMQGSEGLGSSTAIMRAIEDLGGILDAGTYPEYIHVVFGVHSKHWRRVMEIAGDVILRPLFDPLEVEQEKQIITQEMLQHRDRNGRNISAAELSYELMFREHPSEAGTRGSLSVMERFDRESVEEHYRRFFVPENMVVCLAGAFDFGEVLGAMADCFGAMEPAGTAPDLHGEPPITRRRRAIYRTTEALPQTEVLIGHPAYALGDPRRDAAKAVSHMLGGGLSSRLFTWVREELGLVYDVESYLQGYSNAGALEICLTAGSENVVPAVEAALEVVARTRDEGFTEDELERHKEGACCGMEMLCDRASALADWFGRKELMLGPEGTITPEEYIRRQRAIKLNDTRDILAEMLDGGATMAAVGPYGEQEKSGLQGLFAAEEVVPAS